MKTGSLSKVQGIKINKDKNEYKSKKDIDKLTSYVANSTEKAYFNSNLYGVLGGVVGSKFGSFKKGYNIGRALGAVKGIHQGIKDVDNADSNPYEDIDQNKKANPIIKGAMKLGRVASGIAGSKTGSKLGGQAGIAIATTAGLGPLVSTITGIGGSILGNKYGYKLGRTIGNKIFKFRPKKQDR